MTRLLVSVRNTDEASWAAAAGADLIDLKDPSAGALGAVATADWPLLRAAVPPSLPMSVALGELGDAELAARLSQASRFQFAKIGLAGWRRRPDWREQLAQAWSLLSTDVTRVAVAYADEQYADAPAPEAILEAAAPLSAGALLIDTCGKQGGSLLDWLDAPRLHGLCRRARRAGLLVVLAGSLRRDQLAAALAFRPDYVAVRGAVCRPDRTGTLVESLVREWAKTLAQASADGLASAALSEDAEADHVQTATRMPPVARA